MFRRICGWLRQQRVWRKEHEAAWAPVTSRSTDKLTTFQHQCAQALKSAIPDLMFEVVKGEKELYLLADLPNTKAKVYVYENGSNIHEARHDFIAEEWDFKSPSELIDAVVVEAKKRVAI